MILTCQYSTVWTGLPGLIDSTYFLNFWAPKPRALWQEELGYGAADLIEAEESSRMPMGWGAFTISEWVAGSQRFISDLIEDSLRSIIDRRCSRPGCHESRASVVREISYAEAKGL